VADYGVQWYPTCEKETLWRYDGPILPDECTEHEEDE
jgi:hypothetical protein